MKSTEIRLLFARNPGREFSTRQLVERFKLNRGYVTKVIARISDDLKITSRVEDGVVYYKSTLPKGGQ